MAPASDRAGRIETHGIDYVPDSERHGPRPAAVRRSSAAPNVSYSSLVVGGAVILMGLSLRQVLPVIVAGQILSWALVGLSRQSERPGLGHAERGDHAGDVRHPGEPGQHRHHPAGSPASAYLALNLGGRLAGRVQPGPADLGGTARHRGQGRDHRGPSPAPATLAISVYGHATLVKLYLPVHRGPSPRSSSCWPAVSGADPRPVGLPAPPTPLCTARCCGPPWPARLASR